MCGTEEAPRLGEAQGHGSLRAGRSPDEKGLATAQEGALEEQCPKGLGKRREGPSQTRREADLVLSQ